ncbi:hypothetical protein [Nocardioides sp.]|uniref:hypothetical protein n=1 Tax=Nocardioides sp. TaxID=35761 RepID=UPI003D0E1D57
MDVSRRRLLELPVGLAAAGLVAGTATGTAPAVAAARRFPGDPGVGRVLYGARVRDGIGIRAWERRLGHRLGSQRAFFQPSRIDALVARARGNVNRGRLPVLSIKPPGSWQDVAEGRHNAWVDRLLEGLGELNAPICLTVNHEPENDVAGSENTPYWHVAMTEHVLARAASRAPKVNVIQILMQWTFDPNSPRVPAQWVAPSPKLFGLDAYNYWEPGGDVKWIPFAGLVGRAQRHASGRPVIIGEFGVRDDPRRPERGANWIRNAFEYATNHDVVAMNYFNHRPPGISKPFTLRGRRLRAFKECLRDPRSVHLR